MGLSRVTRRSEEGSGTEVAREDGLWSEGGSLQEADGESASNLLKRVSPHREQYLGICALPRTAFPQNRQDQSLMMSP